jgi:hypothetical protein
MRFDFLDSKSENKQRHDESSHKIFTWTGSGPVKTNHGKNPNLAPDLFQSGAGAPDMLLVSRLLR